MDRNMDFNNFSGFPPPYMNAELNNDFPPIDTGIFNPINQYEQAYMYYKYMCKQLEYKMKLKEYEKLSKQDLKTERRVE